MEKSKTKNEWCGGIEMAATELGVDSKLLVYARKHPEFIKSKCFRPNGKVNLTILREILPKYRAELDTLLLQTEDGENWDQMKKKYDALISKNKYEEMEGKYILRESASEQIKGVAQAQKAMLKSKFMVELPSALTGLTTPEIASKLETTMNEICDLLFNLEIKNNG